MRGIIVATIILVLALIACPAQTAIEPAISVPAPIQEPFRGERVLMMEATAYCYTGNRTYTGTWPQEGRTIAVDPEIIPLNSEVYVSCETWPEINGTYIAEDTGGRIKGHIIDLYMETKDECLQWGRRTVEVRVLGREYGGKSN